MQIARFESGKIVERWGSSDEMGIIKTCGGSIDTGKGLLGSITNALAG